MDIDKFDLLQGVGWTLKEWGRGGKGRKEKQAS